MAANYLHIKHPDVEKAQNDVDELYQIMKVINGFFPKGYIELQPLVFHLYGIRTASILEKLKGARVDVNASIVMSWDAEGAPELLHKVFFPLPYMLAFAAGAMFYVVVEELIPEASSGQHSNLSTIGFAIGFVLMMALDVVMG